MLRRLALTLVPGVALYTVATCLTVVQAHRAENKLHHLSPTTIAAHEQLAARSGYIVASS